MANIGIFGGTFDPPHIGHLILAEELSYVLSLQVVYWVLTPHPPHKRDQEITPVAFRERMLREYLEDDAEFVLSRVDLDRSPPHYAADTVKIFRDRYPDDRLVYLIGEDSLRDLPNWERPEAFLAALDRIGVLSRPQVETDLNALEASLQGIRDKVRLVPQPMLQISSSDIRQRIRTGRPYRYFVYPSVYRLIEKEQLYR